MKSLCSKVLVTFADHFYLLRFFDKLSVNKRNSIGFFSRRIVGRSSDRSYNSTDSSLNILNCQLAWLGFFTSCVLVLLTKHTCGPLQIRNSVNTITVIFLWLIGYSRSILSVVNLCICMHSIHSIHSTASCNASA